MDRIYIGDVASFEAVEDFERSLTALLGSGCYVWPDGRLVAAKHLVDRIRNIRIEIYPREHSPPHFHVRAGDMNASFTIDGCMLLEGNITKKDEELVRYWYTRCSGRLVEVWNQTRPTNCAVGPVVKIST